MKRVLLTGGTGFVGANLARRLISDGHDVHLLVHENYTKWRIEAIKREVRLHVADLTDAEALRSVVKRVQPEWIFHLAAHGAYSWQADLARIVQTNLLGTINLVEAYREIGFEAFVNTGASSEYGFKDRPPVETDWLEPNSYYAVAKASATMFCRYIAQSSGLNIRTLRLYSVYGPYEEPRRLIPSVVVNGLRGGFPPLASPDVARDYVYIDDVVDACLLAAESDDAEKGGVYNVGTGVQTRLDEVIDLARRILHISAEPKWGSMPDRIWDTNVWVSNPEKARRQLGWTARTSFEEGFGRTADWFRGDPEMQTFYREALEH